VAAWNQKRFDEAAALCRSVLEDGQKVLSRDETTFTVAAEAPKPGTAEEHELSFTLDPWRFPWDFLTNRDRFKVTIDQVSNTTNAKSANRDRAEKAVSLRLWRRQPPLPVFWLPCLHSHLRQYFGATKRGLVTAQNGS